MSILNIRFQFFLLKEILSKFTNNKVTYTTSIIIILKDTILRSTISDYFENEPDGRLTAWVYPLPRYEKRYPSGKTLPQWQIYLPQILK